MRIDSKPVKLAFTFGFIHGFGFAGVLREMHLPPRALGSVMHRHVHPVVGAYADEDGEGERANEV